MGNLYVIRHGQTTCNAESVIQGPRIDAELSGLGHRQAQALGEAFEETDLDAVYVSPMLRARQTADALTDSHPGQVAAQVAPELYELDYGDYCGRTLDEGLRADMAQVFDAWAMGFLDQAFPGGESAVLAHHRIRPFLHGVAEAARGKDVAVVAHGRINRILVAALTGTPLSQQDRFPQDNASITHMDVSMDGVLLRRINDVAHLPDSPATFS